MGMEELVYEIQKDCAGEIMKHQLENQKPLGQEALLGVENPFRGTRKEAVFEKIRDMVGKMDEEYWQEVIDRISEKAALLEEGSMGRALLCEKMVLEFERKELIFRSYCEILRHPWEMEERLGALRKALRKMEQKMAAFPVIQESLFDGEGSR